MEADIKAYINPYIEHYIQEEKEISQAILITGNWGCGKTYYWKNVLSKKIKKHDLIPVYISLNGLQNKEDILNKWALEVMKSYSKGFINSKTIKATANIFEIGLNTISAGTLNLKKLNLNLSLSDFLSIQKLDKCVLCFDDLERYTGKLSDVLGIINDFTEQKHVKTIVLANIDKIKNTINTNNDNTNSNKKEQSTTQNEDIDNFNIIKEKFFAKIIAFPDDDNTKKYILKELINKTTNIDFLSKNIELILNIMKQAKTSNYRVIKMLLDDFSFFYSENTLNHIDDKNTFSNIKKHFLKFLLCSGLEIYINNLSDKDIASLKSSSSFDIFNFINKNDTPTFFENFINKFYLGDFETAYVFPSIVDYHLTSKIDFETLNNEIKKYSPKEYNNYEYLTNGTSEYLCLSDSMFDKIINNDLLYDIENGKVHYAYYDELFIKYCSLSKKKLVSKSYNDLQDIFFKGLNKIQQEKKQKPAYDDNYSYTFKKEYNYIIEDKNTNYNLIFSEIEKTHNKLKENLYLKQNQKIKQILRGNTSAFIDYINPMKNLNVEDIKSSLFCTFETNELFDILSIKTNVDILKITKAIIDRYKRGIASPSYSFDYKYLKDFSNDVQNKFSKQEHLLLSERLILNFAKQIDSLPEPKEEPNTKNTDTKS